MHAMISIYGMPLRQADLACLVLGKNLAEYFLYFSLESLRIVEGIRPRQGYRWTSSLIFEKLGIRIMTHPADAMSKFLGKSPTVQQVRILTSLQLCVKVLQVIILPV